jgi:hypothetical protein
VKPGDRGGKVVTPTRDRGRARFSTERVVAGLLGLVGALTLGTGLYFVVVRPPMLPEDFRFTGVDPQQLPARMSEWLAIVFRTWGGFTTGFGVLLMGVATFLLTGCGTVLRWTTAAAMVGAFGQFLVSNLVLRSDYRLFIAILFGLAVLTAGGLIVSRRRQRRD